MAKLLDHISDSNSTVIIQNCGIECEPFLHRAATRFAFLFSIL